MASGNSRVGQMFGHYRLTGLLGRGGMGEVYRAEDTKKGRTVALKILAEQYWQDEKFRTRFQRESRAAAVLQEPHVIPIHDWGEIDGHPYIDMRLVEGQTLEDLLSAGPLPPARASFIIGGVAAALDAAHAAGLVHRDVKPQNIIVTPSDFPYLVDFGIASAKGESGLTMTGMQIGTFAYMAPERFRDREASPAVDVYALACVLFECLTGEAPFRSGSMEQLMTAHLFTPPPQPSLVNRRLSPAFDDVIARGMAKEPDDRYGSCGALGRATQRAVESDTVVGMTPGPTVQAPPIRPHYAPNYARTRCAIQQSDDAATDRCRATSAALQRTAAHAQRAAAQSRQPCVAQVVDARRHRGRRGGGAGWNRDHDRNGDQPGAAGRRVARSARSAGTAAWYGCGFERSRPEPGLGSAH